MNTRVDRIVGFVSFLLLLTPCAEAAVPPTERDALIALYNSTGGPGWGDSTNWLGAAGTECTWFGVACSPGDANVIELHLANNNLVGVVPPQIADLTELEWLLLYFNQLSGSIPSELGTMTMLTSISLTGNQLIGGIPPEIGSLTALGSLRLGNNQLSGTIPPSIGSLTNLVRFDAHNNRLTGAIPLELGGLVSLEQVRFWGNSLNGAIPAAFAALPLLMWVDLGGNELSGSIPPEFGGCPNLNGLILNGNELEGGIPVELGLLTTLGHLDLADNRLTGTIPSVLGDLSNLGFLNLGENQLTGSIPSELGDLNGLTDLFLNNNHLEGVIPAEIGDLTALVQLHFENNNLTGSLPPEIGNLGALNFLDLGQNHLSGSIPSAIGDLSNLGFLSLSQNRLSGVIPPQISGLVNLGELFLGDNLLEGVIPPAIGSLPALWALDLSYNRLEGSIPTEFGNLGNLQWFNLRANKLMGPVPASITGLGSLNDQSSDLTMNGLFSSDPGVIAFLDQKCGDHWKNEQTVMPTGFAAVAATGLSVTLNWDPIPFSWLPGGYDILISEAPAGPFTEVGRAIGKSVGAWTVFGLAPSTNYYFKICAVTDASPENQNTVVSEFTPPSMAVTTAVPSTWFAATNGVFGNDCASPATPCPTIQSALDLTSPGEQVMVAVGTYSENLILAHDIKLVGEDPATTILQGHNWGPVVDVQTGSHSYLGGFTIRGGQVEMGGGVYIAWRSHLVFEDSVVTMNTANIGGGVYVECEGSAVLNRVLIHDNIANERGGGVFACGALSLNDSRVSMNSSPWGGGVAVNGETRITGSTVSENVALDFAGGGLLIEGRLIMEGSTVSGNTAGQGGGIMNHSWSNLSAVNSTISGNAGGGIFNDRFAWTELESCTVAYNTAPTMEASGLMNWDQLVLHNTIVAGNQPVNCANWVRSEGYNLEDGDSCGFDRAGDRTGEDPLLGPLADNGGPTLTHALPPGSPAVDAGDPAAPLATDQRGSARPVDGDFDGTSVADIGAFEYAGPLFFDDFETGDTSAWSAVTP